MWTLLPRISLVPLAERLAPPDAHWVQGIVERLNRSLKNHVRKFAHTCKDSWSPLLPIAVMA